MFEVKKTDILVIGGGGAGIRAAIAAAELGKKVILLSKGPLSRSGITPVAGEGVEGAVNPGDSPALHYQDTIKAGRGLADEDLAYALAQDAVARIHDLETYGAKFKKNSDGSYATSVRPGQSHSRNLFIIGGGYGLAASLFRQMSRLPIIQLIDDAMALKLLVREGKVTGAVYLKIRTGEIHVIGAGATVLAVGGYEELWPFTDTPPDTTGEGLAMAYKIGARLMDLEMVQFYPGVVVHPPAARGWLVQYEYILNPDILDGRVLNGRGEVFVQGFPARDEFIRAIRDQNKKGTASPHGGFYVDLTQSRYSQEVLTERLTGWLHQFTNLKQVGIDLRKHRVEMAPAAHYCLGGVQIDEFGQTNVPGLFAAGEVSANVHGANRLSGNALSETQVFGQRAAQAACEYAAGESFIPEDYEARVLEEYKNIRHWKEAKGDVLRPIALKSKLQAVVDRYAGLERDEKGLSRALEEVRKLRAEALPNLSISPIRRFCYEVQEAYEVRGMMDLAELVILSALERRETRGHHFRLDYPETLEVPYHTSIRFLDGTPQLSQIPVTKLK
jgi:succinate dehydrogenase/fumarate reductase flavoprotein subunit